MAEHLLPDQIINLIFEETGQQVTKDDPIVGLIIAQHHLLDHKLQQLEGGIQNYSRLITQGQDSLNVSLESLRQYREDILSDLVSETKRHSDKVVDIALKEYGNILITSHVSRIQTMLVTINDTLTRKMWIVCIWLFVNTTVMSMLGTFLWKAYMK